MQGNTSDTGTDTVVEISQGLQAEIDSSTGWMYPWRLTPDLVLPTAHPELPGIHATRERLVASAVQAELRDGGSMIDLGSHEGWFAQRALEWGADRVLAVDVRELNVRRATLLRDHFGIGSDRLALLERSVYDISPEDVGLFDVVLNIGLIYHLEDPIGAIRTASSLAVPNGLVVVESQLHRGGAVMVGRGITGEVTGEPAFTEEPATWAAKFESLEEQEHTPLAAYGGVISLVPNEAAVIQAMEVIGLQDVKRVVADADENVQYRRVDRGVFVGRRPG